MPRPLSKVAQLDLADPRLSDLIDRTEAAALAGLAGDTFGAYVARQQNGAPQPVGKIGRTRVWRRSDVQAWLDARSSRAVA